MGRALTLCVAPFGEEPMYGSVCPFLWPPVGPPREKLRITGLWKPCRLAPSFASSENAARPGSAGEMGHKLG